MPYRPGPAKYFRPRLNAAALLIALVFVLAASRVFAAGSAKGTVDFNRDIRPILSDNCYACHGPDAGKRKAGLRLDQKEGALAELKSGNRAIIPGDPARSALVFRITTKDEDDHMPPAK